MKEVFVLIKRDINSSLNRKFFILLAFLLLFQLWFVATSGSVIEVQKTGEMFYMAAVFSFNFFGSIVALALNYDGISAERESKFMDLILTSGISKRKVYLCKVITSLLVSGIFAILYSIVVTLAYLVFTGDFLLSLEVLRYIGPITVFLLIFSLLGLALSAVMRSSKASLVTSIIFGAFMMPRLFILIVDGVNNILGFSEAVIEKVYMISPALILNALNGYSDTATALWGLLLFAIYTIGSIVFGVQVFQKQDELSYGE